MKLVTEECGSREQTLTNEERNLLSVAYKNVVGSRRSSWRVVSAMLNKAAESSSANELAKSYLKIIEDELNETCAEVLVSHKQKAKILR